MSTLFKKAFTKERRFTLFVLCIAIVGLASTIVLSTKNIDEKAYAPIIPSLNVAYVNTVSVPINNAIANKQGLMQAKSTYLHNTTLNPLLPVNWANLAAIKWHLQEFDEEMSRYLAKADTLGPQSIEVHILYTHLGMALYNTEHPMYSNISGIVRERIMLGLRNEQSKKQVLDIIASTGTLLDVCRWIKVKDPDTATQHLPCS